VKSEHGEKTSKSHGTDGHAVAGGPPCLRDAPMRNHAGLFSPSVCRPPSVSLSDGMAR
jgi:hypothetical protein